MCFKSLLLDCIIIFLFSLLMIDLLTAIFENLTNQNSFLLDR